jgi:hypothetical protein
MNTTEALIPRLRRLRLGWLQGLCLTARMLSACQVITGHESALALRHAQAPVAAQGQLLRCFQCGRWEPLQLRLVGDDRLLSKCSGLRRGRTRRHGRAYVLQAAFCLRQQACTRLASGMHA